MLVHRSIIIAFSVFVPCLVYLASPTHLHLFNSIVGVPRELTSKRVGKNPKLSASLMPEFCEELRVCAHPRTYLPHGEINRKNSGGNCVDVSRVSDG